MLHNTAAGLDDDALDMIVRVTCVSTLNMTRRSSRKLKLAVQRTRRNDAFMWHLDRLLLREYIAAWCLKHNVVLVNSWTSSAHRRAAVGCDNRPILAA